MIKNLPDKYVIDLENRLWSNVNIPADDKNACWLWIGKTDKDGYGHMKITVNGKSIKTGVHRIAYMLTYGDILPGNVIMHKCDTPACCSPRHLSQGTHADNVADMDTKGRRAAKHLSASSGSSNPNAKLNEEIVANIRLEYKDTATSYVKLAKKYGVSSSRINDIINNKAWALIGAK